jgi:transposase-like protein
VGKINEPKTLIQAVKYYADADRSLSFVVKMRWPDGVVLCPTCKSPAVYFLANQRRWECKGKHPRRQFSVKVGTIFEDSPLGLDKWLPAMWMLGGDRNGISSCELARSLGVTQKTAWFMLQRIRLAMKNGSIEMLNGSVEVDETYVGGKTKSKRRNPKTGKMMPTGPQDGKDIVMGLIERNGRVRASVVPNAKKSTLRPIIEKNVAPGAILYTDALGSYEDLRQKYKHYVINHSIEYVNGHIHTNGIENFWSCFKRTLSGTYTFASTEHLNRYLDEQIFRHNNKKENDGGRFKVAVRGISGKRLTYKALIGKV